MLLGESAPNLVILKFDALSPSRKRVLSYKSAVTGKRVLSYTSAVTGKRVLSSYIGRVGYRYLSYDTYSLVTQESTLLLLGESAPNLINFKFDSLSPSRKRVLS